MEYLWRIALRSFVMVLLFSWPTVNAKSQAAGGPPTPLLEQSKPTDWWFAFKFNAYTYPRPDGSAPTCIFGGKPGGSREYKLIGQSYAVASDQQPTLQMGAGYLGDSTSDPLGATFSQIYATSTYFVVWNDQFYGDPLLPCETDKKECAAPWGHSKGVVMWDKSGSGVLLQVTTPDWPGSGVKAPARAEGNSLGCTNDNDVLLSQDFFALNLTEPDLLAVLDALKEEGAVTDPRNTQLVRTGGPEEVQEAVAQLGSANTDSTYTDVTLSSGVRLIAKSGGLEVPPWQMISALLGQKPLRVASFWSGEKIYPTQSAGAPGCWEAGLGTPGPVDIAETGTWNNAPICLSGTACTGGPKGTNHAKIAVATGDEADTVIFSDMNQDGTLTPLNGSSACDASQNKRGGMFFLVKNKELHDSIAGLLKGLSPKPDPDNKAPIKTEMR